MYSIAVISLSTYTANRDKIIHIYEMFKDFIPPELKNREEFQFNNNRIQIPINKNSETFQKIIDVANIFCISYHTYEFTEYDQEEIRNAQYFQMFVSDPLESESTYARDYGTKYINACNACNIGGILDGDVFVDRKFVKKYSIASLRPDIFVSKEVKWLIETNGLTGVEFEHVVKDYKGREIPEYHVMSFKHTMPPLDSRTWLSFDPPAKNCDICGKMIPYLKSHFYYKSEDFRDAKDFNLTSEAYDNFSERGIVVSKKVKDIFSKAKVRVGYRMLNIV